LLHDEAHRLFADEMFSDLFKERGRDCVPPRVVAVVMVLQRMEGLSDREAVERFEFDARWKYAAGGLDFEYRGFVHTVLVNMRARLQRSARPDRIFEAVLDVANSAGLVGRKRVLDSTALYDAVATQDTVTMIRSSIRGILRVAGDVLAAELRAVLKRDDDYANAGKASLRVGRQGCARGARRCAGARRVRGVEPATRSPTRDRRERGGEAGRHRRWAKIWKRGRTACFGSPIVWHLTE
jgi:hypothetical protein